MKRRQQQQVEEQNKPVEPAVIKIQPDGVVDTSPPKFPVSSTQTDSPPIESVPEIDI